ncbi:hypothetical protein CBR_g40642 [Chara braunii]|uniref:Uncharacterized protein n=1 Tax=Chara braunii TaxID=69332 RepID=A0A388LUE2_CHABU|nr:hypothetical protein CBR_g40642 [Chara braunii]|eukprot:GBG85832.1 hypothetical protein CBR_g40642 [Chara braunii]
MIDSMWTLDRLYSRSCPTQSNTIGSNTNRSPSWLIVFDSIESNTIAWTHDRLENDRVEHDRVECDRVDHDRVEHHRVEHDRVEHDRVEHDRVERDRDCHNRVEHDKPGLTIESNTIELACQSRAERDRVDHGHDHDRVEHDRGCLVTKEMLPYHYLELFCSSCHANVVRPSDFLLRGDVLCCFQIRQRYKTWKERGRQVNDEQTRQNVPFATFELTMVLNGRGERIPNIKHVALRWAKHAGFGKSLVDVFNPPGTLEVKLPNLVDVLGFFDSNVIVGREPIVHPEDRISEPKCVLSRTVETGTSITICDTPHGPKAEQIGDKGPCRGLVVPSAPMKTRPTTTKTPVALGSRSRYDVATKGHLPLVGQQRYDYSVLGRVEEVHEYFEDEDEENNEEYSERAGGQEQYAAGVGGMIRHPGETSKVVRQDEDSEHTVSASGGEVGPAGGYGSSYEGYEGDVHATVAVAGHIDAVGLAERKRKHRRERKSLMDNKRSRQEAGEKRRLKIMPVDEAVQRTREIEAAAKKKQQPKKRKAKGGVMKKSSVFPAEQPQSDEEAKGKTITRPPSLQNVPSVTSSSVLSKGFFLELDKHGNQCPDMEFISVQFDRILDIPDGEFRYNQRYLVQQTVDDIYDAMIASGEAAMRERMTGAAGVNVCTLYEKPVLLLVALRDTLHTDASERIVRARRVLPDDFDLESVNKYYYYPLSGQHNVAAARRCFVERPDIAQELRLDRWTAMPIYYPDKNMDNYCTLSTFQNSKDKWNTPPHQNVVVQNIRKLWHESNCPEAKGGSAAEVKNAEYRKFAGEALRLTGIRNLIDMSLTTHWSG